MDNTTIRGFLFTCVLCVYFIFVYNAAANFKPDKFIQPYNYMYSSERFANSTIVFGPELEKLNVSKPFVHYAEAYDNNKLPRIYVENTIQEFTTAPNYSFVNVDCTETLILIKTARKNAKRRNKMRKELKTLSNISHYFMLGLSVDKKDDSTIAAESIKYGDLVIGQFIDDYYNLTIKSLSALDWTLNTCNNTKSIILCDDDVQFKDKKALHTLATFHFATIACLAMMKPSTIPVMRHGKWGVTREEYNRDTYPAYCIGPAIGFTRKAAQVILNTAKMTKSYKIDDVFISGVLRYKAHLPIIRHKAVTFTKT